MTGTVERVDPNDDAGEDDAMLQEGMVSKEGMESLRLSETLTPNSYSLIYIGDPKTSAFWYGITFFVFQTTLPLLALSDLVDFTTTLNPFRAPPDVTLAVRTAGFLTLLLAVIFFRDLLDAFERLHEGYDRESALAQCPHATFCKWLLAYALQLINGLIFLVLIFILNVQSTTVVGMLLNFAALGFITEIDDFAFELALRGYFSDSLQQTCEHVTKHKTPDMKGPLLRKIALFFFSCAVWGPYFYVVARSQRGDYVCTRIEAQFGDSFYPELQQSSGAYFVDFTYRENDRLLYQDEATGIFSIFRYCFSEKAWVFGILSDREVEDYDDLYDEICERGYWISKGPESPGSFNILDKSPMDWKTTKADDPNDFLAYPVDYFSLTCLECNKNTCNEFGGECGLQEIQGFLYNVCLCYEGYFGERCEYTEEDICDELGYDSRFESFEPLKPDFPESFKLVQNSTAGEFFNYYNKAVYSYEDATTNKFYLIAYFGRRYYMLNGDLDSLKASIGFDDDDVDLDAYFMYIEFLNSGLVGFAGFDYEGSGINPIYVSEPIDLHTANDKPTPAEIGWFYTDDRLTPGPPVSTRLMRPLTLQTTAKLFATGFTVGPVVDSLHNQCLLKYDLLPISLEWPSKAMAEAIGGEYPYFFCSSLTVPPLLGVAYVVLGGVLPRLFDAILSKVETDSIKISINETRSSSKLNLQRRAIIAVATTALIIKLSEFLECNPTITDSLFSTPTIDRSMAHFMVMIVAALSQWAVLDGSLSALLAASVTSIGGPLSELPFVANGFWEYLDAASDYFPLADFPEGKIFLQWILGDNYQNLALSSITGPCYFAVTMDAIALGRWFDDSSSKSLDKE